MSKERITVELQARGVGVPTFAKITGLGRTTVFEMVAKGAIRSVKVGRRRLIPMSEADRLLTEGFEPIARSGGKSDLHHPLNAAPQQGCVLMTTDQSDLFSVAGLPSDFPEADDLVQPLVVVKLDGALAKRRRPGHRCEPTTALLSKPRLKADGTILHAGGLRCPGCGSHLCWLKADEVAGLVPSHPLDEEWF